MCKNIYNKVQQVTSKCRPNTKGNKPEISKLYKNRNNPKTPENIFPIPNHMDLGRCSSAGSRRRKPWTPGGGACGECCFNPGEEPHWAHIKESRRPSCVYLPSLFAFF